MAEKEKTIPGARVAEISVGRQTITFDPSFGFDGILILQGINRQSGLKVGDTGKLTYRSSPSAGLWYFVKDDE